MRVSHRDATEPETLGYPRKRASAVVANELLSIEVVMCGQSKGDLSDRAPRHVVRPVMTRPRLLVVDDHPDTLRLLETYLALAGFDVVSAANGAEALDKAMNGVDAIATDLAMPEMDGFELIRRLRAARSNPPVPIVAVTGQSFDRAAVLARSIGCCWVLQKPCDLGLLADVLRSLARTCEHDCAHCPNRTDPAAAAP